MTAVRSELAALLSAARSAPDEDTPRLVLADWLDEQDNPRDARLAAHVRAQIASPHCIERGTDELRALFPRLAAADKDFEATMSRGTLSVGVRCQRFREPAYQELVHTEDWLWVERLGLSGLLEVPPAEVLASPLLPSVRELRLSVGPTEWLGPRLPQLLALLDAHLPNLDALTFDGGNLQEEGFRALREWPRFARLRRLGLDRQSFGNECAAAWRTGSLRPRLEALSATHNRLGASGLTYLVQVPGLENLRELDLSRSFSVNPNPDAFTGAAFRDSLRALRWESVRRGNRDANLAPALRALLTDRSWPALEVLDLSCPDSEGPFGTLTDYERLHPDRLPRLHTFCAESWMFAWPFAADLLAVLARNGFMGQLRTLRLGDAADHGALTALARTPELAELEVLELFAHKSYTRPDSWEALVGSDVFRALHRLGIGNTVAFREEHARALVESEHFPELRVVSVGRGVSPEVKSVLRERFAVWE